MNVERRRQAAGVVLRATLSRLLRDSTGALDDFGSDALRRAHFIRTRMKRLQSLSRLVPKGASWRREFLPPCREVKSLFAEMRDADIVRAVVKMYASGEEHSLHRVDSPDTRRATRLVEKAVEVLSAYSRWESVGWGCIADRAVGTYRAARRWWKLVRCRRAPDEAFHGWRRRVKRLLYQCEYLGGCARLAGLTKRVDRLGEVLGGIQDLGMAEAWLGRAGIVSEDLGARKEALRRRAVEMGDEIFASRPREFRAALG